MSGLSARILGLGLWTPGYADVEAWRAGRFDPELTSTKAPILDRQCSRRASPFAKIVANAFEQAATQAAVDLTEVATVFGSSLGESSVMLKLLDQMYGAPEDFSPMLFAVSVHNAASGLVSISTKNRAFTTSVAADFDTPAMAILEAMGASRDLGVPAVLVCGDEASPVGLVPEDKMFSTLGAAIVLDASDRASASPVLAEIDAPKIAAATIAPAEAEGPLARNPQAGLLDLVDAVVRGRRGRLALDRGAGNGWSVEVRGG